MQARLHPGAGHLVHAGGALRQNHSGVAQSRLPFAARPRWLQVMFCCQMPTSRLISTIRSTEDTIPSSRRTDRLPVFESAVSPVWFFLSFHLNEVSVSPWCCSPKPTPSPAALLSSPCACPSACVHSTRYYSITLLDLWVVPSTCGLAASACEVQVCRIFVACS